MAVQDLNRQLPSEKPKISWDHLIHLHKSKTWLTFTCRIDSYILYYLFFLGKIKDLLKYYFSLFFQWFLAVGRNIHPHQSALKYSLFHLQQYQELHLRNLLLCLRLHHLLRLLSVMYIVILVALSQWPLLLVRYPGTGRYQLAILSYTANHPPVEVLVEENQNWFLRLSMFLHLLIKVINTNACAPLFTIIM